MGLDMYLTGEIYISQDWKDDANNKYEEGYRLKGHLYEMGYWRKHPDLHGYIVENFAEGEDDCKPVYLSVDSIKQIIDAIEKNELPKTDGFFFGESTNDDEEKAEAIGILSKALGWLEADDWHRSVVYQASW